MTVTCAVLGCLGSHLQNDEIAFFKDVNPWGFILFRRNIVSREQVRSLCEDLRSLTGRKDTPILIDQEGGRVQRMRPPVWSSYPSAEQLALLYSKNPLQGRELVRLTARLIADDLQEVGINVNCAPVLDVRATDANPTVIGDRSFGNDADIVTILGRAYAEGLLAGCVLPVIKHMPGHGRARVDSHETLPLVDASSVELESIDFKPFLALKDMPAAIPAHVVYTQLDNLKAGTISSIIIQNLIRKTLKYKGLLITDDLSMNALSGSLQERTASALAAGCDIALHCNGNMEEMISVAKALKPLEKEAAQRARRALDCLSHHPEPLDRDWAWFQLNSAFETSLS